MYYSIYKYCFYSRFNLKKESNIQFVTIFERSGASYRVPSGKI